MCRDRKCQSIRKDQLFTNVLKQVISNKHSAQKFFHSDSRCVILLLIICLLLYLLCIAGLRGTFGFLFL